VKPSVYILYSKKSDKHYIGFTTISPEDRLARHLNKFYEEATTFTKKADDWVLIWHLERKTIKQGRSIEAHIKKMRSSKYIQNLIKYPEIAQKLLSLY